jgi:hypothetical protein
METPALLSRDHLTIYLNDHLAGATAGVDLARRTATENAGSEFGPRLRELADEIGRDRDELLAIIDELDRPVDHVKVAVGWGVEKLGRLKPNGGMFGYSPLSRLLELEGLASGIRGKAALWRALATISPQPRGLEHARLELLEMRAEEQLQLVDQLHARAADLALSNGLVSA